VASLADDPDVTVVDGALGHHPLLGALTAAGISRGEAQRIARSLAQVRDVDRFSPKDTFTVARDKASGRVIAYEIATSPLDVWQAREDAAGGEGALVTRKLELLPEQVRVSKAVVVGADLRASLTEAGLTPIDDMLAMIDDALDGHAELSDIRPGARLRVVATQEHVGGAFLRWSSLDAVEYFPATPNAPPVRVYRFEGGEEAGRAIKHHGWYDARGRQPYRGGFRTPVPLARVASRFNPHRMHPVLHVVMPHNGVDFAAPSGAPVYATAAGVVTSVGADGPCGNKVEIAHAGGYTSVYCHLSRFAAGLRAGQHVESRQLIAYVGQTGRVTGPHLHFGVRRGGVFIDPMTLRLDGVRVVPRARRDEFDRMRAEVDAELDSIPLPAASGAGAAGDAPRPADSDETFYEEP
jgi:murein DD-endopeptidase MepM/ murein hydrolase activator NlpD